MGLTVTQKSIINKAQSVGGSKQGVALDDEQCGYLAAVVAANLRLRSKLHLGKLELPPFFGTQSLEQRLSFAPPRVGAV